MIRKLIVAALQNSWVTEEEFAMGFVDLKPPASPAKVVAPANSSGPPSASAVPELASLPPPTAAVSVPPSVETVASVSEKTAPVAAPPSAPVSDPAPVRSERAPSNPVKVEQPPRAVSSSATKPSSTQNAGVAETKPAAVHPPQTTAQPATKVPSSSSSRNGPEAPPRSGGGGGGQSGPVGVKVEEALTKPSTKPANPEPEVLASLFIHQSYIVILKLTVIRRID